MQQRRGRKKIFSKFEENEESMSIPIRVSEYTTINKSY